LVATLERLVALRRIANHLVANVGAALTVKV
jgi:hypothetical protein